MILYFFFFFNRGRDRFMGLLEPLLNNLYYLMVSDLIGGNLNSQAKQNHDTISCSSATAVQHSIWIQNELIALTIVVRGWVERIYSFHNVMDLPH